MQNVCRTFFKALFSSEKGTIFWHTWKIQVSICAMKRSALILPTPFLHKSLHWYTILMVHHWSILNSIVFTASSNLPTTVPFLSRLKQPNNIRYKRRAQMPFTGPKIEVLWSPPEIMNLQLGAQKINPTPSHVVPLCSSTQPKGPEDSNLRTWKSLQTFCHKFQPTKRFFLLQYNFSRCSSRVKTYGFLLVLSQHPQILKVFFNSQNLASGWSQTPNLLSKVAKAQNTPWN